MNVSRKSAHKKFFGFLLRHFPNVDWQKLRSEATAGKVAVIGSSPISIIAAHLLSALGHEVHLFELEEQFGGAWGLFEHLGFSLPKSTHIMMPNTVSRDFFVNVLGIGVKDWQKLPTLFSRDLRELGEFPDAADGLYSGNSYCYSDSDCALISMLVGKVRKLVTLHLKKAIKTAVVTPGTITLFDHDNAQSKFDAVYVTPATKIEIVSNDKPIPISYDRHINKSAIFSFQSGSDLLRLIAHFKGDSMIREIQLFAAQSAQKKFGITKLSRFGADATGQEIEKFLTAFVKSFHTGVSDLTLVNQFTYINSRLTEESQLKLARISDRLVLLPFGKKYRNTEQEHQEQLYRASQDLGRAYSMEDSFVSLFQTPDPDNLKC